MSSPLFYRHKPVFGLDIGRKTIKVIQLSHSRKGWDVVGYGSASFDRSATKDGVIVKPQIITDVLKDMFKNTLIGEITTNRAVASVPIAHIYTRILQLPKLAPKDLADAVRLEAEQYVPLAGKDIYVEYKVIANHPIKAKEAESTDLQSVLMVATPKKIVSSYLELFSSLNLDVQVIEPNMFANLRATDFNCHFDGPNIVIDFGAQSSDLAIYDQMPQLVGTVSTGGDQITDTIAQTLKLSHEQAHQLKIKYGIAKSRWQSKLATALQPILSDFANEVQKMMRYYHEHSNGKKAIGQIAIVGGGANMPGLADFLSHLTGVNVIICDPWEKLRVEPLQPPSNTETTIYTTAVGLGLWEGRDD